jgi:hypothetical protein
MSDNYARRLMLSSEVAKSVPMGTVTSERQARELARVEPARRQEVVEKASAATGGKITAAALMRVSMRIIMRIEQTDTFGLLRFHDAANVAPL